MSDNAAKVSHLSEVLMAPVPEVVAAAESLLERARSGKTRGLVLGEAVDQGCDASSYVIGDGNIATLVLSCERLKRRLLDLGED